eukprot:jgi/Ulvmu1/4123/UM019_0102.1
MAAPTPPEGQCLVLGVQVLAESGGLVLRNIVEVAGEHNVYSMYELGRCLEMEAPLEASHAWLIPEGEPVFEWPPPNEPAGGPGWPSAPTHAQPGNGCADAPGMPVRGRAGKYPAGSSKASQQASVGAHVASSILSGKRSPRSQRPLALSKRVRSRKGMPIRSQSG